MTSRCIKRAVVSLLLFSSVLHAQEGDKAAKAGVEAVLLEKKQRIDLKTNPVKGVSQVWSSGTGTDQVWRLTYLANDTSEETTDQLEYTLDGNPNSAQKLSIHIEPKSLGFSPKANEDIFKSILLLFFLAVVIESALALVFNWRPFVETFNARAVRPLLSFLVAYTFVETFRLDLMTSIVNNATTANLPPGLMGKVLTAMVLAGGSAGVNNLLVALGYRQKQTPETVAPKPPQNRAWIAVRLNRKKAVGQVEVLLGTPAQPNAKPPLAGIIHGTSKPGLRYFLSDPGRFPGYGGHEVPANSDIVVELTGVDSSNGGLQKSWGPVTVAGGAILDLDFEL